VHERCCGQESCLVQAFELGKHAQEQPQPQSLIFVGSHPDGNWTGHELKLTINFDTAFVGVQSAV
jgi:hypothetical protein